VSALEAVLLGRFCTPMLYIAGWCFYEGRRIRRGDRD
jgi:hypothetical protein